MKQLSLTHHCILNSSITYLEAFPFVFDFGPAVQVLCFVV